MSSVPTKCQSAASYQMTKPHAKITASPRPPGFHSNPGPQKRLVFCAGTHLSSLHLGVRGRHIRLCGQPNLVPKHKILCYCNLAKSSSLTFRQQVRVPQADSDLWVRSESWKVFFHFNASAHVNLTSGIAGILTPMTQISSSYNLCLEIEKYYFDMRWVWTC